MKMETKATFGIYGVSNQEQVVQIIERFSLLKARQSRLSVEQVTEALQALGETGSAKVENGGLYTRREENCDWLFEGVVNEEAREQIECWFA
jgi:hypothetical protein